MLRISEPKFQNLAVTLKLEGRLVGLWVAELKRTCEAHLAKKRFLALDFAEVSFADRAGIALLAELRAKRVAFLNCSAFLEEEMRTDVKGSSADR